MLRSDPAQLVVVDDEPEIRGLVADYLGKSGFSVRRCANGQELDAVLASGPADLVVLDVSMPGEDGFAIARRLRAERMTPIIMLTASDDVVDRIVGLEVGADDYLTKPFSPAELTLRIQALLRRLNAPAIAAGSTLVAGPLTVDRAEHRALLDGEELNLTATEYKLLVLLLERRGRVQTRPQLLETVWEAQPDIQTRTVDMHVQRLRSKLGEVGEMIETVRGFGYRFKPAERGSIRR